MAESRPNRTKLFHRFIVKADREIKRNVTESVSKNLEKASADIESLISNSTYDDSNHDDVSNFSGIDYAMDCSILTPLHKSDSEEYTTDTDDYDLLQDPFIVPHKTIPTDCKNSLSLQLGEWSINNNITQLALTSLLHILNPLHPELPLDARTLLRTERIIELKSVQPGEYFHFGFRNCIEKLLSVHSNQLKQNNVELTVNIDGLPLTKSSTSQCYPILCKLFDVMSDVQIIGLYHGNDKPSSANIFLESFIDEATNIINNGITYNGQHFKVKIKAFICDVPAKSFIKYTRGHSGYNSCTKCTSVGVYLNRRMCFRETSNLTLRTDSDFRNKIHEQHHTGTSIIQYLPNIDMIRDFPNEYMHLICLGVVKKLIVSLWIDGNPGTKLSHQQVSALSDSLLKFKAQIPLEFNRKTRSLTEAKRWKATEFRLFLFYVGPVVTRNVLSRDKYVNFLTLHVAMTILASEKFVSQIEYANSLLKYFVDTFKMIYGEEYVSHNIHNLLHLSDDVKYFGRLDLFSAFPFENHMQSIKKLVRKGDRPLQQICKRILEQQQIQRQIGTFDQAEKYELSNEHFSGPLIDSNVVQQYKTLKFSSYCFSTNDADNCSALTDGSIIVIRNLVSIKNEIKVVGNKFKVLENFYQIPCESSKLKIYKASSLGPLEYFNINDIAHKCMKLTIPNDEYVIFPLIHTRDFETNKPI